MVIQVLPFLILGLGIDDTFVIVGAYQRVQYDLPVQEKIAQTLERAGSSIFVTSATDFCAFLMGLYTRLPALRAFSAHAAMAIFFDFAYQVPSCLILGCITHEIAGDVLCCLSGFGC